MLFACRDGEWHDQALYVLFKCIFNLIMMKTQSVCFLLFVLTAARLQCRPFTMYCAIFVIYAYNVNALRALCLSNDLQTLLQAIIHSTWRTRNVSVHGWLGTAACHARLRQNAFTDVYGLQS